MCTSKCPGWLLLSWLGVVLCTKKLPVQFLVSIHVQIVGSIPGSGHATGSRSMFCSYINVFLSLPFSLKINLKNLKN